jgi:hypothetical protein
MQNKDLTLDTKIYVLTPDLDIVEAKPLSMRYTQRVAEDPVDIMQVYLEWLNNDYLRPIGLVGEQLSEYLFESLDTGFPIKGKYVGSTDYSNIKTLKIERINEEIKYYEQCINNLQLKII